MGLTALQGGSTEEILESGITVLGFEAVSLAQRGLHKRAVKAAIKARPELVKADSKGLEAGVKKIGEIVTGRGGSELGPGIYFSTSKLQAKSYAAGKGALGIGKEKGGGEVIKGYIKPGAKLFALDTTQNPKLFNKLMQNKKFVKVWKNNWNIDNPTNKDLWDAAQEAHIGLQKILKSEGYQGAWHHNYATIDQPQGSKDISVWDKSILTDTAGGIEIYRGQQTPKGLEAGIKKIGEMAELEATNKQLLKWSETAKKIRKTEVEPKIKELRKRQASRGRAFLEQGLAKHGSAYKAIKQSIGGYKDTANIPEITPPKLTEAQWEGYAQKILKMYPDTATQFQATDTGKALDQLRKGKIPTNRQFRLLEPLFGRKNTEALFLNLKKQRKFSGWDLPAQAVQAAKSIFGLDIQTLRQARSFATRHPILYGKAAYTNIRSYLSEDYAIRAMERVQNSPGYKESTKYLNYVGEAGYATHRLEYYSLGLTERLLVSKNRGFRAYGKLLQASERGAVAGINTMMKSVWDIGQKNLTNMPNITPKKAELYRVNRGKTINTFMKILRSKNRSARRLQNAANYILFSPSMTVARPLSIKAILANKGSRGYAGELLASNIASIYLLGAATALVGSHYRDINPAEEPPIDSDLNPTSGGWGKLRVGNDSFDASGGDAPFYRTLMRIGVSAYLYGKEKVTKEKQTEWVGQKVAPAGETVVDYLKTRETALIGLTQTLLTGKDWLGKDIPRYEALLKGVTPEVITSVVEAGLADGLWETIADGDIPEASRIATKNLPVGLAALASVGVSSYPVPAGVTRIKFQDIVAQHAYDKTWDELKPAQQRNLNRRYKKEFEKIQRQIKVEGAKEKDYEYLSITAQRNREAGDVAVSALSREAQDEFTRLGVTISLDQTIRNYKLNDERYVAYQQATGRRLAASLDQMISSPTWKHYSDNRKEEKINRKIMLAKRAAQREVMREVKR
ncbi:MAG: hypothetical protein ACYTF1_22020 [Planctomycetota bacterium]|jgi:hypothetical protein